jgi:hypothetical protein
MERDYTKFWNYTLPTDDPSQFNGNTYNILWNESFHLNVSF